MFDKPKTVDQALAPLEKMRERLMAVSVDAAAACDDLRAQAAQLEREAQAQHAEAQRARAVLEQLGKLVAK